LEKEKPAPCTANVRVDAVWEKVVPLLTS
jgi:hypothetical protein